VYLDSIDILAHFDPPLACWPTRIFHLDSFLSAGRLWDSTVLVPLPPGVIIRFRLDYSGGIGNNRRSLQIVSEVIEDASRASGSVAAGNTFAVDT
jgi:hypothetical protein